MTILEDSDQNSNIENGDDKNYKVEQGNNAELHG